MKEFIAGCALNPNFIATFNFDKDSQLRIDLDNVTIGADIYLSEDAQRQLYEWLGKALGKDE